MDTKKQISDNIRAYFRSQNIPLVQVAERLGQTKGAISNQLNSPDGIGGVTAKKWAKEFGFNPSYLMFGEGSLFPEPEQAEKPTQNGDVVIPSAMVSLYNNMAETIRLQQETIQTLVHNALCLPTEKDAPAIANASSHKESNLWK